MFMNTGSLTMIGGTIETTRPITGAVQFSISTPPSRSAAARALRPTARRPAAVAAPSESSNGKVTISNSTLTNNKADYGGGVYLDTGSLTIIGGTMLTNTADYKGGAIYDDVGNVKISGTRALRATARQPAAVAARSSRLAAASRSVIAR